MNNMMTMIRDVQGQLGTIANFTNLRQPDKFSSKIKVNPGEHMNVITLNSGKQLKDNQLGKNGKMMKLGVKMNKKVKRIMFQISFIYLLLIFLIKMLLTPFLFPIG